MSPSRQPIRAAFAGTLVWTVVPALAGIVSSVTLARTLDPFARGEMAAVLLWPMALGILGDPGLSFALSYRVSREPAAVSGLWTIGILMAVLLGGVLAVAGGALLRATLSLSSAAWPALRLALAGVPLSLFGLYASYLLLGSGRLRESNLLRGGALVLYATGVVTLASLGRGSLRTYAGAWVLAQLATAVTGAVLVRRRLKAGWRWDGRLWRPVFSYGLKVYASALAAQTSLRLDQLLMSALGLSAQLGLYVVAVAVASATQPFFSALAIVSLQHVTASRSVSEGARETRGVLRLCLSLGIPLVLLGVVVVPAALPVIFGRPYTGSTIPAQLLLAAAFFQGLNAILGNALRGLGLPGRPAVAEGLGSGLTIVLLVWLLPRFGAVGAAVASLATYGIVTALLFRFLTGATQITMRDLLRRTTESRGGSP